MQHHQKSREWKSLVGEMGKMEDKWMTDGRKSEKPEVNPWNRGDGRVGYPHGAGEWNEQIQRAQVCAEFGLQNLLNCNHFSIPEIPFEAFLGKSVRIPLIPVNTSKVISGSVTWRNFSPRCSPTILLWIKNILFLKVERHESQILLHFS